MPSDGGPSSDDALPDFGAYKWCVILRNCVQRNTSRAAAEPRWPFGASLEVGVWRLEMEDMRDMAEKWEGEGDASKKCEPMVPMLADETGREPGVYERNLETFGWRKGRARSLEGVPFILGELMRGGVKIPAEDTDTEGMWSEPSCSCTR